MFWREALRAGKGVSQGVPCLLARSRVCGRSRNPTSCSGAGAAGEVLMPLVNDFPLLVSTEHLKVHDKEKQEAHHLCEKDNQ